jgi:hypothetical protein
MSKTKCKGIDTKQMGRNMTPCKAFGLMLAGGNIQTSATSGVSILHTKIIIRKDLAAAA